MISHAVYTKVDDEDGSSSSSSSSFSSYSSCEHVRFGFGIAMLFVSIALLWCDMLLSSGGAVNELTTTKITNLRCGQPASRSYTVKPPPKKSGRTDETLPATSPTSTSAVQPLLPLTTSKTPAVPTTTTTAGGDSSYESQDETFVDIDHVVEQAILECRLARMTQLAHCTEALTAAWNIVKISITSGLLFLLQATDATPEEIAAVAEQVEKRVVLERQQDVYSLEQKANDVVNEKTDLIEAVLDVDKSINMNPNDIKGDILQVKSLAIMEVKEEIKLAAKELEENLFEKVAEIEKKVIIDWRETKYGDTVIVVVREKLNTVSARTAALPPSTSSGGEDGIEETADKMETDAAAVVERKNEALDDDDEETENEMPSTKKETEADEEIDRSEGSDDDEEEPAPKK